MIPMGDLFRRLAVAAVGIPLFIFILYLGGWALAGALAVVGVLATRELFALASARGTAPFPVLGGVGTVALILSAGWLRGLELWAPWAIGTLFLLFFLASTFAVWVRGPGERPLFAASLTLVGALYWGVGLSFAVFLRHMPEVVGWPDSSTSSQGVALLAFPFAVTWTADSAAYLFGHAFGKKKMAPTVSPGKTVVGGVASLLTAILTGALIAGVFLALHPNRGVAAGLGAAMGFFMGITVQLGDLIESLFKREAGVKDSASLLPGHGGVLDRFDALIFTVPLTYALIRLVGVWS
jgi:phosphatidate cytidylyltransferase